MSQTLSTHAHTHTQTRSSTIRFTISILMIEVRRSWASLVEFKLFAHAI